MPGDGGGWPLDLAQTAAMRLVSCCYISHPLDATPLHLLDTALLAPAGSPLIQIVARLLPRSPRCKIHLVTFQAHDLLAASRKILNAQLWAMALDLPARARVTQPLIREHARPAQWKQPSVQRQHFQQLAERRNVA